MTFRAGTSALFVATTTACSLIAPSDSEFLKPPASAGTGAAGAGATAAAAGMSGSGGTSGSGEGGSSAGGASTAGTGASQGAGGTGAGGTGASAGDDGGSNGGAMGSAGSSGETGSGGSGGMVADGAVGEAGDASGRGGSAAVGSGGSGGIASLPLNGMVLWLTATQGVVRSGTSVTLWEDQSPFGNDATQSSPSAQPTFGGHWRASTIDFDGYDDFLVLPASATLADFSRGLTAFFATESHGGGPCQSLIQFSNGAGNDEVLIHRETAGDFVYQAPGGLARCPGDVMPVDEPVLAAVVHGGTEASLFIDGLYCGGGAVGALTNVVKNSATIGRAAHPSCARFSGHMGEIIVYNRPLTAPERMAAERHLQIRWDL